MDALNSGKFPVSTSPYLNLPGCRSPSAAFVWFCHSDVCCFCGELYRWQLAFPAGFIGGLMSTQPTQLLTSIPALCNGRPLRRCRPPSWCADYFYRRGLPCEVDEPENQLPDFLLAFKTTFLLPILSAFLSCWRCTTSSPPLVAGSTGYPYCADCRR